VRLGFSLFLDRGGARWTGPFCATERVGVWGSGSVQRMQRSCWEGIVQSAEGVQLGGSGDSEGGYGLRLEWHEEVRIWGWVMEMRMVVGSRVQTTAREEVKGS
jgi:hypothetical protein